MGSKRILYNVYTECRNAKGLLRVGLHWRVPVIEDLSETLQVVW